ncbi:MAG TPA: hypothetical protein VFK04_13090 [Gemmatimonadaceae bacterium]|nr:hypothetical protein [Gemmatimonadaceae bacterium]
MADHYRAEAKAWRAQAEHIATAFREEEGLVRALWSRRAVDPLAEAMCYRAAEHHTVSVRSQWCPTCGRMRDDDDDETDEPFTRESRILAALFLALECEDDARLAAQQ